MKNKHFNTLKKMINTQGVRDTNDRVAMIDEYFVNKGIDIYAPENDYLDMTSDEVLLTSEQYNTLMTLSIVSKVKELEYNQTNFVTNIKQGQIIGFAEALTDKYKLSRLNHTIFAIKDSILQSVGDLTEYLQTAMPKDYDGINYKAAYGIAKDILPHIPELQEEISKISFNNNTLSINWMDRTKNKLLGTIQPTMNMIPHNILDVEDTLTDEYNNYIKQFDNLLSFWVDDELERTEIKKMMSYAMTKRANQQKMFYIYGQSGTGKSTFAELLRVIIGVNNIGEFIDTTNDNHITENIAHKLVAFNDDLQSGYINNEGLMKSLAGGGNIKINPKGKTPYSWKSYATPIFLSNYKPEWKDKESNAIKDRMIVFTFDKVVRGTDKENKNIDLLFRHEQFLSAVVTHLMMDILPMVDKDGFRLTERQKVLFMTLIWTTIQSNNSLVLLRMVNTTLLLVEKQ